jgi:TolB-like protein/DNA-binding SARP family transcriptional activator
MVKLLGSSSIDTARGALVTGRAAQGRRLALLAILALARGRPISRDKIVALLWPESTSERARHQLSDAVYIIRGALGENAIRSAGDELLLDPAVLPSDVAQFERSLDEGHPDAAVALYRGALLDGFHLSDAAEFERWLDGERARLAQRYAVARESLALAAEERGDMVAAVEWWRKLAAHDPYSGRITLRLMRALDAEGNRAGALQHARAHATLLREDFDAEPDSEVSAFAELLRSEPTRRRDDAAVAVPERAAPEVATRAARRSVPPVELPAAMSAPLLSQQPRKVRGYLVAPVAALLLVALVGAYQIRAARLAKVTGAVRSVAVLPFVNMTAEPDKAYFSDGLTEEIITALSRIEGLRVAARTSSFALRDRGLNVRAIGDTLGVGAVLEGSVRSDGTRLRVTAQLIDAGNGYHIWSGVYDRALADVLAVQDEIAHSIAAALELTLARPSGKRTARRSPDPGAYDLYLRGLYLRNSLSTGALRQAVAHFDSAIALAPDFALAYAGKASVIAPQIYFGQIPQEEGVRDLRMLSSRALELEPTLGEAHVALGILRLFFDWDWPGAEQALRRAIELNPNDAHAYHHLANYFSAVGRFRDALAARERAAELDPLNPRTLIVLGNDRWRTADSEGALAEYRRAQALDPMNPLLLGLGPNVPSGPARVYHSQGRYEEMVDELARIATLRGASPRDVDLLRRSFADSGLQSFWRSWLAFDRRQSKGLLDPLRAAALWALIGDTAQSVASFERAYAARNPGLIYVLHDPMFALTLSHPAIARLVREMRFPSR